MLTKATENNVMFKTEIEVGEDASAATKMAAGVTNVIMGTTNPICNQ